MARRASYNMSESELDHERKLIARLAGGGNHDFFQSTPRPSVLTNGNYKRGFITNCDTVIENMEMYWYMFTHTGTPMFVSKEAHCSNGRPITSMVSFHIHPTIPRDGNLGAVHIAMRRGFEEFKKLYDCNIFERTWNKELFFSRSNSNILTLNSTTKTGTIRT